MTQEQNLGTARIDVVVNNDQMAGKLTESKRLIVGLSQEGQAAFDALTSKQKRAVESLNLQVQAVGRSRSEMLLLRAEAKQLPASIVADFARQLQEVETRAKGAADQAADLSNAFTGKTFSDTQLYKANQALGTFRTNAEAAREAAANVVLPTFNPVQLYKVNQALSTFRANAEEARAAAADVKIPSLSDTQLFKANQALSSYRNELDAARVAQLALAQAESEDETRIKDMVRASLARVDAERQVEEASRRVVVETNAQRDAVDAAKSSTNDEARVRERAQAFLSAENRTRQQATSSLAEERNELVKLLGQIDPTIAALDRLDKMEDQLRAHRGKTLDEGDYQEFSAKINQARENLGRTTISAGQTREALRQLPMQFTDIATSLAGGQSAWLVFLQQGGQIKDSFGGIAPAIRGVLSVITPLAVALGVAGLAAIALGAGAVTGYQELDTLNRTVIATGKSAGVTGTQLDQMAVQVGAATGHWSEAREAIEKIAATGKVAGAGLSGLGELAVNMAELTGDSVDKVVQELTNLGDKPADAAAKLNEQYHFLTASQYAHIQALEEEGRTQEAARLAQSALGEAMAQRAKDVDDNAGVIVRAAHGVRDAWNEAWNAVKSIGKTPGLADQAASIQGQIDNLSKGRFLANGIYQQGSPDDPQIKALQAQLAEVRRLQVTGAFDDASTAEQAAGAQDSIAAQKRLSAYKTPNQGYNDEVAKANADRMRALYGVVDEATRAKINAEADAQIEKAKEARDAALKRVDGGASKADESGQVAAFKASLAAINDGYKNNQAELDAQRKSGAAGEADYYQQSQALLWQNESDQVTAIQAEIDRLDKRKAIGADRIQIETQVATLTAQAAKVEQDAISKSNQLDEQQQAAVERRKAGIEAYDAALQKSNGALQQQMDSQVARIKLGDREYAIQQAISQASIEQADKLQQLALQKQAGDRGEQGGITQDQYDADVANLQKATDQKVAIIRAGYDDQKAAEADWQNGLHTGYTNWVDQASNAASQVSSLTSSTLDNFTDSLTNALDGGKLKAKDFATTFLKELARIEIRIAASKVLSSVLGSLAGGANGDADYDSGFSYSAKGNVYASPDLARYSGKVYDTPQVFAFAKGAGVFGEAGPEAIMPLTRDSQGRLGVRSQGSGSDSGINVEVQVTVNADGTGSVTSTGQAAAFGQQLGQQMKSVAQTVLADAMRPGGSLWAKGMGR